MKSDRLATLTIAGLLLGAIVAGYLETQGSALCDRNAKLIETTCLEFWLYRYQTTIQTLISSGIGAVGLYFVLRQLAALGQQNEMTRAALQATLRQQAAAERGLRGKAQVAFGTFVAAAVGLFQEALIANDPVESRATKVNYEPFQRASAALSDIAPGLESIELRAEWSILYEEYGHLFAYIGSRRSGLSQEKIIEAFLDKKRVPANPTDAAVRAWGLSDAIRQLSAKLNY